MKEIRELIVRMATDNPSWVYCRIQGSLKHLGLRVARSTSAKTLKEHGIRPSPHRVLIDERLGGLLRYYQRTAA